MKKIFKIVLSYLLITFNTFVFAIENKDADILKIGALLPLTGELKNVGEDMLYAINLALHDIDNSKIKIYPKDSGTSKEQIIRSCEEFLEEGVKVIIGPVDSKFFKELNNFQDLIFISLSNMSSRNKGNIITMGINLESQLLAIKKFIEKEKKKKTVILYPKNEYAKYVEKNIKVINFTNTRLFSYSKDPKVLTKQIEKLTNYKQRKINLESRIKKLEGSEDPKDLRELNRLKQKYTLGKVNFDSVVIIDFGDGLKSVLTSLAYTDVSEKDILIITGNQWFDDSIITETSIKNFYFPSINLKSFEKFNGKFLKIYKYKPNEITILAYDIVALIYYIWKKEKNIVSANNFNLKKDIKGKIGNFKISDNKVIQKLNIYKLENGKFIKNKI
tara:strand:- start:4028 stop:5191 length:1164 start_codon:yes stop_codon:yes gene_type:complete